ncbi:MAG: hypothetical protein GF387_00545 [Candidatus Portnoybacteria bacterium]|nr:hypothetical protein [Candidatus Portnoybacteria bacterium]
MKNWRFYTLLFFIAIFFGIIIFRLFSLQVLSHAYYQKLAENQHEIFQTIYPDRGEIFMRDRLTETDSRSSLFPAVINKDWWLIYAIPKNIEEKKEAVEKLSPLLNIEKETLEQRIGKEDDPYEPLESKVDNQTAEKIKDLEIPGIGLRTETWRYYPAQPLACHIIGFVGYKGDKRVGRYGIEEYYEEELAGQLGMIEAKKDSLGNLISVGGKALKEPKDGADIILTIDPNIQFFIEKELKEAVNNLQAEGGTIIVMDTRTGAIKGMANYPTFNNNEYSEVKDINLFLNPAIHDMYEPGSIFKAITMAAGLDTSAVNPRTTYEDKGLIEISGHKIKNSHEEAEGIQTMVQVLEKSLNTGAVFVQQKTGKKEFKEYIRKFGFNRETGIDLTGEAEGNLSNLETNKDLEYATAAFGQGIAVTSIQMISAITAIANNGILLKPHVAEKIIYPDGKIEEIEKEEIGRVISSDTASRLTAMLVSVVENGFGKKAGVSGYAVAGKTGTAQIPEKGGYSKDTIHIFGGFFPAFNSRFSLLVKIDKPQTINFASDSVAPIFGKIAKYILNYYEISPSQ